MTIPASFICAALVLIFSSCKRTYNTTTTPINCDGLITDTAGTGDPAKIYIANAFTPNGDGLNDIIKPITQNVQSISFTIYDESNNLLSIGTTLNQGWIPASISGNWTKYYYKIQATTTANHKIGKCGEFYRLACFPSSMPQSQFYFEDQLTPNGFTGVTAEKLSACP